MAVNLITPLINVPRYAPQSSADDFDLFGSSIVGGCGSDATSETNVDTKADASDAEVSYADHKVEITPVDIQEVEIIDPYDKDGDTYIDIAYVDEGLCEIYDPGIDQTDIPLCDCNDWNTFVNPGAKEVACDGIDNDCYGGDLKDVDQDGYEGCNDYPDCDDNNSLVNPEALEIPCNDLDENCDGEPGGGTDNDGDGIFIEGLYCGPIDCNDNNPNIGPGLPELCDGIDNDCDEIIDEGCEPCEEEETKPFYSGPVGTENVGNCKPGILICENGAFTIQIADVIPQDEICNNLDDDCDGQIDEEDVCPPICIDNDLDGFGENCELGPDCDDTNPEINPLAEEIPCNGIDEDCDGEIDEDGVFGFTDKFIPVSNADVTFIGEDNQWRAGIYVSANGDYNGDGKKDLIIGSLDYSGSGYNYNNIYLFYGGELSGNYNLESADAVFNIGPTNPFPPSFVAEYRICANGDINGDNFDDLLINPDVFTDTNLQPIALFYGGGFGGNYLLNDANAFFVKNDPFLQMITHAAAGDTNNDGLDDLLFWNSEGGKAKPNLILGQNYAGNYDINNIIQASFASSALSGFSITDNDKWVSICDVNGDQSPDLLMARPTQKVYLFYDAQALAGEYDLSNADAIINFGNSASYLSCSDINQDGSDDILISVSLPGGDIKGSIYIFNGGDIHGNYNSSQADLTLNGETSPELSSGISAVGDLNNDGYPEIIISNPWSDGVIYILTDAYNLNGEHLISSLANYIIEGENQHSYLGHSISIGDVNGDGIDDLFVGAPGSTIMGNPENDHGKAYLFYGQPSCTP